MFAGNQSRASKMADRQAVFCPPPFMFYSQWMPSTPLQILYQNVYQQMQVQQQEQQFCQQQMIQQMQQEMIQEQQQTKQVSFPQLCEEEYTLEQLQNNINGSFGNYQFDFSNPPMKTEIFHRGIYN
ncbi:hypothetical protein TRFO_23207 [Tritrichomonas foetus]|uniref:Uncharacterized protein n=1 Tax=Tritrichomonas foetus TaxID=1144522 RepID=A0A1J4KFI3_9EUKA|nr:hypothetical protein TRFO_23207 [Tritrichomonas foetus]|eukprot:OHT08366.1 hypothetical protein TRFO_23207 [Tritrichomonas foetus]